MKIRKVYKHGNARYQVDLRSVGMGRKDFETISKAEKHLEKVRRQIEGVREESRDNIDWTFHILFEKFLDEIKKYGKDHHNKERALRTVSSIIIAGRPLAEMKVAEFVVGDITTLVRGIRDGRARKTVQGFIAVFRQALEFAIEESVISQNPFNNLKEGVVIRTKDSEQKDLVKISEDIIHKIADVLPTHRRTMVLFSAYTGLRQGELRALTWDDIDFVEEEVTINKSIINRSEYVRDRKTGEYFQTVSFDLRQSTKTKAGMRKVPMAGFICTLMKQYKLQYGNQKLVFPSGTGRVMSHTRFSALMKSACKKAGVKPIRWHDLRHYCASQFLKVYGNDWNRVKTYIGHASIRTTIDTYGHWIENKDEKIAAKELLNERLGHIAEQVQ